MPSIDENCSTLHRLHGYELNFTKSPSPPYTSNNSNTHYSHYANLTNNVTNLTNNMTNLTNNSTNLTNNMTNVTNCTNNVTSSTNDERPMICGCCPFGYHIDRDFVGFSKDVLSPSSRNWRVEELKEKWRSERQSMDKLLGIKTEPWEIQTLTRPNRDVWEKKLSKKDGNLDNLSIPLTPTSKSAFVFGAELDQAVEEFEETLLRSKGDSVGTLYSFPDEQKFHTFPRRIKLPLKENHSNNNCHSYELTSVYKSTYTRPPPIIATLPLQNSRVKVSDEKNNLFNISQIKYENNNFGGKKGLDFERLKFLEERIKLIPQLEDKLRELENGRDDLENEVKSERKLRAKLEEKLKNSSNFNNLSHFESRDKKRVRDASTSCFKITKDVGISHSLPHTRTVGVGSRFVVGDSDLFDGLLSSSSSPSPTGSLRGVRRRGRTFEAGVQVNESNPIPPPLLSIVETKDFGTQTNICNNSSITQKNIGVLVKPTTKDFSITFKPRSKDVSSNTVDEKIMRKSVGTVTVEKFYSSSEGGDAKSKKIDKNYGLFSTSKIESSSSSSSGDSLENNSPPPPPPPKNAKKEESQVESKEISSPVAKSPVLDSKIPRFSNFQSQNIKKSNSPPPLSPKTKNYSSNSTQNVNLASNSGQNVNLASNSGQNVNLASSQNVNIASSQNENSTTSSQNVNPASNYSVNMTSNYSVNLSKGPTKPPYLRSNTYTKESSSSPEPSGDGTYASSESNYPITTIPEKREKVRPSKEMEGALKVLNDALLRGKTTESVTSAIGIILHEWFRVAGSKTANAHDVEDYLDLYESYSPELLKYIVNMPDGNGNSAVHYAVSHGNFDVVSILLDSQCCDINRANKAGYTSIMLLSLAKLSIDSHASVVRRLCSLGDVNIKASQHGQTALMLAASHGRLETCKILLEAGADINIRDDDGSTALMCAAEHGHSQLVNFFVTLPECDLHITDNDGSNALSVAMEAGHKDIGVTLYAHMHLVQPTTSNSTHSTPSRENKINRYSYSDITEESS